jgi:hypothetical protein
MIRAAAPAPSAPARRPPSRGTTTAAAGIPPWAEPLLFRRDGSDEEE